MSKSAIKGISTALICVFLCLSSACTTMRLVPADSSGDRIRAEVKSGDTVRVLMIDGAIHTLKVINVGVSSVEGEAINTWKASADAVGMHFDLHYQDIQTISIRHFNVLATVAIVAVVVIAAAVGISTGGGRHTPGFNR